LPGFVIDILAFAVVFTVVVVVHEGGHFLLARLSGIGVEEFAVGFGPRILSVRRRETVYALRAIPVGGFVKMPGMIGLEGETDMGEKNFNRATIPRRAATIVAGVVFNLVFGGILLTVALTQPTQSQVVPGDPAQAAGIRNGDVILRQAGVSIDQSSVQSVTSSFHRADAASEGRPVAVEYRASDGAVRTTTLTPSLILYPNVSSGPLPASLRGPGVALVVTSVNGGRVGSGDPAAVLGGGGTVTVSGHLDGQPSRSFSGVRLQGVKDGEGVAAGYAAAWRIGYLAPLPGEAVGPAVVDGFRAIPAYLGQLVTVIGQLFVQPSQATSQLQGPVGIAASAGSAAAQGWVQFVTFVGTLSLALGFFNVIPIPFLDGGRLLFIGIEAVRRRQIAPMRQAAAIGVSLAFIILVAVLITINDIGHLTSGGTPP
jgi:regulator of sigma E protease